MDRRRLSVFAKFVGYSDGTEYDSPSSVSTISIWWKFIECVNNSFKNYKMCWKRTDVFFYIYI